MPEHEDTDLSHTHSVTDGTATRLREVVRDETVRPVGQIELREERLIVEKRREVAGSVTFTRELRRETVKVPVELVSEVVVIEHHGGTGAPGVIVDGVELAPGARREITLYREEATVDKQVVVAEQVNIGKRTVTEKRVFDAVLGREELVVTEDGAVQRLDGDPTPGIAGLDRPV